VHLFHPAGSNLAMQLMKLLVLVLLLVSNARNSEVLLY